MQTILVLLPIDLAGQLEREADERGVLVAELAGLILHAALIERLHRADEVSHD